MPIRLMLVPLFWVLACASARPPSTPSLECGEVLGDPLFTQPDATHVLLADFYGVGPSDQQFADTVAAQIDWELKRFQEEELPGMPVHVPPESIEIRRLRCFLKSHAQAETVAAALNADLVIWGRAYCNANPAVQQQIQIEQRVQTGDIKADANAKVTVGQVNVEAPKAYAVCPNATLHRSGGRLRRSSDKAIDIASLAHLDLPTLSSKAPFQLISFTLGLHFFERGQPWIAARFFERSVEHVLSPQDENLGLLHLYLGRAFLDLPGGADRAISYSKSALQAEKGRSTARKVILLNNIGAALRDQGKYADAISYYERALKIRRTGAEKGHPTTADLLNNIGATLSEQGKYTDAIGYYERALKSGEGHLTRTALLNNIGAALMDQGKYAQAISYYERALKIDEQAPGKDHPGTAAILNNIAGALMGQGKYTSAIGYYERALRIDEQALGKDHPTTATLLNNIGSALDAQGKYEEAIDHYERALKIIEQTLGKDHPTTVTFLNNIGGALMEQGKYADATSYYERALKSEERAPGGVRATTVTLVNKIGEALINQGKYAEAIGYYERALKIDEQALGKDHPDTARDLNNIGWALDAQGRYVEAIDYLRRALVIWENALGREHPNTRTVSRSLAFALVAASGRRDDARGPVVTEVLPGSQAAALNLKLGDWIVQYGGVTVRDTQHLGALVRAKDSKAPVALGVVRDGKRLHISATGGPLGVRLSD